MKAISTVVIIALFAHFINAETDTSAASSHEFETAKTESASNNKDTLKSARERLLRVIADHKTKTNKSNTEPYLYLGRVCLKLERWEEAKGYFIKVHRSHSGNLNWIREAHYRIGYCYEKLGKPDAAIAVYKAVVVTYSGTHTSWSCQALERGYDLAIKSEDNKTKIEAYIIVRKTLINLQNVKASDDSSGALTRMRKRLPKVRKELGLTQEQTQQVDEKIGLAKDIEGEKSQ